MKAKAKSKKKRAERSVLELTATQTRSFLLKPESYCRLDLPSYFDFGRVLQPAEKVLSGKSLASFKLKPRSFEDINYTIYSNKDGRYAWEPFQLIHPVVYVDLAHLIIEPKAWAEIQSRFAGFANDPRFKCLSIPQESSQSEKTKAPKYYTGGKGLSRRLLS